MVMKTAEEILDPGGEAYEYSHNVIVVPRSYCLTAMQEYADQFKPKWVSVEDKLPDSETSVLAMDYNQTNPIIRMCIIRNGEWMIYRRAVFLKISHWMPLPNPPQ